MARLDRSAAWPDWRNVDTYAYTAGLDRKGWAWEFLRRNPRYRADAAASTPPQPRPRRKPPRLELLALTEAVAESERWGLMFL